MTNEGAAGKGAIKMAATEGTLSTIKANAEIVMVEAAPKGEVN